ncbi:hypothetical protein [[Acholeplasma] multilocale]|uniref:hypothetical protein n=1 Tax=[Acholeplasma] multilocale TaxID=264638 RepID=UPI00047DE0A3|nr:hypothetical protein [[Acholeplasma] multilocale]
MKKKKGMTKLLAILAGLTLTATPIILMATTLDKVTSTPDPGQRQSIANIKIVDVKVGDPLPNIQKEIDKLILGTVLDIDYIVQGTTEYAGIITVKALAKSELITGKFTFKVTEESSTNPDFNIKESYNELSIKRTNINVERYIQNKLVPYLGLIADDIATNNDLEVPEVIINTKEYISSFDQLEREVDLDIFINGNIYHSKLIATVIDTKEIVIPQSFSAITIGEYNIDSIDYYDEAKKIVDGYLEEYVIASLKIDLLNVNDWIDENQLELTLLDNFLTEDDYHWNSGIIVDEGINLVNVKLSEGEQNFAIDKNVDVSQTELILKEYELTEIDFESDLNEYDENEELIRPFKIIDADSVESAEDLVNLMMNYNFDDWAEFAYRRAKEINPELAHLMGDESKFHFNLSKLYIDDHSQLEWEHIQWEWLNNVESIGFYFEIYYEQEAGIHPQFDFILEAYVRPVMSGPEIYEIQYSFERMAEWLKDGYERMLEMKQSEWGYEDEVNYKVEIYETLAGYSEIVYFFDAFNVIDYGVNFEMKIDGVLAEEIDFGSVEQNLELLRNYEEIRVDWIKMCEDIREIRYANKSGTSTIIELTDSRGED